MTVLIEATDRYRSVLALAELDPKSTDGVILLADPMLDSDKKANDNFQFS